MKILFAIKSRKNGILIISENITIIPVDDLIEGIIVNNTLIELPEDCRSLATSHSRKEHLKRNKAVVVGIIDFFDGFTDRIIEMLRKGECVTDGVIYANLDFDKHVKGMVERGEL